MVSIASMPGTCVSTTSYPWAKGPAAERTCHRLDHARARQGQIDLNRSMPLGIEGERARSQRPGGAACWRGPAGLFGLALERRPVRSAWGTGMRGRPAQPAQLLRLPFFLSFAFFFFLPFISSLSKWATKLVH
jgi:hypothetical protein